MSEPTSLADALADARAQVEALVERVQKLADKRSKEGRQLGTATREQLSALSPALHELARDVDAILTGEARDATQKAAERQAERFERLVEGKQA